MIIVTDTAILAGVKPLLKLEELHTADGSCLELWERDGALSLLRDGAPIAATYAYGSEQSLAELATAPITRASQPCIMLAGLGLGYGLAQAQASLPREKARFIVAEPVPEIVEWNRRHSPNAAALEDKRVTVEPAEAAELCRKRTGSLHAVIMRHTHAPCEMSLGDAQAYFNALKGGSLLAISLARPDRRLEGLLKKAGFEVSSSPVAASAKGKQLRMHTVLLARRGRFVPFAER